MDSSEKGILSPPRSLSPGMRFSGRSILSAQNARRITWALCALSVLFGFLVLGDIYAAYGNHVSAPRVPHGRLDYVQKYTGPKSENAVAVLLAENYVDGVNQNDTGADDYFRCIRLLNFQFKHANSTRYHDPNTPFLVLVTPTVAQNKREILRREGATVVPVDLVDGGWSKNPTMSNWNQVFSKLEIWRMTEYKRILLLDADHLLLKPLDGIFEDPGARNQTTEVNRGKLAPNSLPASYIIAGLQDRGIPIENYFNAGFFVASPSLQMYDYLREVLKIPNSFPKGFPEQNLLNEVHRGDGPMPWGHLDKKWNAICATAEDMNNGMVAAHGHWWNPQLRTDPNNKCAIDPVLAMRWWRTLGQMEAFYGTDGVV